MTSRKTVLGTVLDGLTMSQVIARCVTAIMERKRLTIGVVNAAKVVNMRADAALRESVAASYLVLADGQAVVWAARLLGHPVPERVAGIDLFTELMAEGGRRGYRAYFLGATPEVLGRMLAVVRRRYPGLAVAGSRDGYFPDEDSLYNPRLKRRYDVRDDIPVMLVDEATTVDDSEHERVMAKVAADGISPTFSA